jgi:translation initiation factor IF-1
MVKNTTGGSKTKGQARKFVSGKPSNALRLSNDDYEVYAQVIKQLGGPMCHVSDINGKIRLCHIRGKFRGRGKRDNLIENGSWVLVGLREWEAGKESTTGKLENCDLLEVYNSADKDKLKNTVTGINWNVFIAYDLKTNLATPLDLEKADTSVVFTDEKTDEYKLLIEQQILQSQKGEKSTILEDDDEIDIDDI